MRCRLVPLQKPTITAAVALKEKPKSSDDVIKTEQEFSKGELS